MPSSFQRHRLPSLVASAAVILLALSGCSAVDGLFPVPTVIDTTSATPTPTPTSTPYVPSGDLAGGTITHTIPAGSASAQLIYFTAQDPNTWTADLDVPINISLSMIGVAAPADPENAQQIKVTRFLVQREGEGGYDLANDAGEFVVTPPYSYASTVVLAAQSDVDRASVRVTVDLIFETAPDSNEYTRQTIVDTLNLAFAPTP
ncbi:hypothetical protein HQQ80_16140 [Microbacteriaceae bacterium VKM Ac-2855]|nr:hypothetical protein [Microbacteriaceae bacterium VKM Ac-2855]